MVARGDLGSTNAGTPLGTAISSYAARVPDELAVAFGDVSVTRGQLDRRTNRLARALGDRGVRQDDYVTIALPNGLEFLETVIAVWKLGAVPQPVSHRLPAAESDAILSLVDPALLVGLAEERAGGRTWLPAGFEADDGLDDGPLPAVVSPSWKAPTSGGSTGRPKVIVAGERGIVEALSVYTDLYRMSADTVMLCTGPLYHNGPFNTSSIALLAGGKVIGMPRFDAEETLRLVEKYRVTWLYLVPTMMSRIIRLPEEVRDAYDLSSLRIAHHTAAPCPAWLKEEWIDWLGGDRVIEIYGGTEVQAMTFITGTEWVDRRGSVGRAGVGEICVLDDDGRPLAAGETGKVWMRRGTRQPPTYHYLGAEAVRNEDGWEWLGDVGRMDEDGYLFLADRDSDLVLVGGANVYPAEVEAALDLHPAIESSCVVGLPDDDLGNVPHAALHATANVTEEEIRAHMKEHLAPYKWPRSYEFVDQPLRDDAGKVRRSEIRADRLKRLP